MTPRSTGDRLALVVVAGAVALAYLAPWPLVVNTASRLVGDASVVAFNPDLEAWAHHTLYGAVFLAVAAVLWATDRWLAAIVAMASVQTFLAGPRVTTLYLLIGVLVLMAGRWMPSSWRSHALNVFGISAVVQALLILVQWAKGAPPVGTFGIAGLVAGYLAVVGFVLPGRFAPLLAVAILLTGSRAGLIAFACGLAARYLLVWPAVSVPIAVALLAVVVLVTFSATLISGRARLEVQAAGLRDLVASPIAALVGFGIGTWSQRRATSELDFTPEKDGQGETTKKHFRVYVTAHNDLVQWVYETGALGVLLLAGWFWRWRRRLLAPPLAPAYIALAVMSLTWFPFHDLRIGIPAALLVGVGSPLSEGA